MNLASIGHGDFAAQPKAYPGGATLYPLGGAFADIFRKDRLPSGVELIQQCVGVAYACATLNADLLAGADLHLYLATPKGASKAKFVESAERLGIRAVKRIGHADQKRLRKTHAIAKQFDDDTEIEEVVDHPLLDLLNNPEPDAEEGQPALCGYDLRWLTQMYLETVGAAYWYIEKDKKSIPRRLILLRAQFMRAVPSTKPGKTIEYYEYGGSSGYKFDPAEIVKFRCPWMSNPYLADKSPLEAAIEKVRIGRKMDAHTNSLLDNMGRPDAIWTPKGDSEGMGIGEREARRLRGAMREAFAESGRGGLMVAEFPGQLQPLQWAPQDVVELERARAIKTDVANCFGVPDSKLERNDANLASVTTADIAHKIDAGIPRCDRNVATLNHRLVFPIDPSGRLFFGYDLKIPEDKTLELETLGKAGNAVTLNEVRDAIGLSRQDWGDQPYIENTMVPIDLETGKPETPEPTEDDKGNQDDEPPPKKPKKSKRKRRDPLIALAKAQMKIAEAVAKLVESKDAVSADIQSGPAAPGDRSGADEGRSQRDSADRAIGLAASGGGHDGGKNQTPATPAAGPAADATGPRGEDHTASVAPEPPAVVADEPPMLQPKMPADEPAPCELLPPLRLSDDGPPGGTKFPQTESVEGTPLGKSDHASEPSQPDHGAVEANGIVGGSGGSTEGLADGRLPIKSPRRIGRINADGLAGDLPEPIELTAAIQEFFRKQQTQAVAAIQTKSVKGPGDPGDPSRFTDLPKASELLDWEQAAIDLANVAKPFLRTIAERAANEMNLNLGITSREDIAVVDRNLDKAIDDATLKFADSTNQTTRLALDEAIDQLKEQLREGLTEGDPLPQLTQRVQSVFEDASADRAKLIARTESSRAIHTAELISATESKVVKTKTWLASADACDFCLDYAAQGAIPLDKNFGEDDYGPIKGPPGHPRCQCSLTYEITEPDDDNPTDDE